MIKYEKKIFIIFSGTEIIWQNQSEDASNTGARNGRKIQKTIYRSPFSLPRQPLQPPDDPTVK